MRIGSDRLGGFAALNQEIVDRLAETPSAMTAFRQAVHSLTSLRSRNTQTPPARSPELPYGGQEKHSGEGTTASGTGDRSSLSARVVKYGLCLAGAGYAYDKVANDFPLSTTSLHDGKRGFTSNQRLKVAQAKAREYYALYHAASHETQRLSGRSLVPFRTCGNNQFVTMIDYRAATRVHVVQLVDSAEARGSLVRNLACMKGHLVNDECVAKYKPPQVPNDPDLTKSPLYNQKNKYALTGVLNKDTGAYGYTSRSVTQPFVNKGVQHFRDTIQSEKGLTFKRCTEMLEALLQRDSGLSEEIQFAAGQAILNFRQVYAADAHWGHAENVLMKTLAEHGLLSLSETAKLDATLMFEDPDKNRLKRNTSLVGPWLHKLDIRLQEIRSGHDPAVVADLNHPDIAQMRYLPIAHFKLNEQGNGFEDCSGFGDSFTCANAVACINHARLMSGQQRLSKEEVIVIVACLNAVYDDTSSIRHTLHEIARGCFAGAGYTIEDADEFYAGVCRKAAEEYYGGRSLSKIG
ncbi:MULTISPECIES: XopAG/AvrGf1 family type III secretion system effector [unclassified Sinorhizobium]|uniref:XopAG/AvrGf1 family type III secretion system effector n=1 Tax=unclassified Sinorhizobium TaxID=2613772 RepID=UPI0024C2C097|nr:MULTISPECIES: XopAG/AvrGf1 family type III secretion system effector [unclassified Sinorhizobium]MDK1378225.1 XopAG/AvrGf1 family type III secretion system effector [Sinorhizobium sp. 6-70]MDK1482072.1 XopAG/AvrGf1 family type III secretion system effector [Sinorhizobium sp. 6-117]